MADRTIYVFLSYTRREEEVQRLQPVTDAYCDLLQKWARTHRVHIFYDRSSIPQDVQYSDKQLEALLRPAVLRSHLLVSFLSPQYIESGWCRYEYKTKWTDAPGQIHNIYWKPEIAPPTFLWLSKLLRPSQTQFLTSILNWNRIRHGDRGHWRDTRFKEWVLEDDPEHPANFSDVTDVYTKRVWAGPGSMTRCVQRSAVILCREHPSLFDGEFSDYAFFESLSHAALFK
jgi:hypothetical protein